MSDQKSAIAKEMERYFTGDQKRIDHNYRVTSYAEELMKTESGDEAIIVAAGLLHDVGIPVAIEKYGSSAPKYQEQEGPPIAREILSKLSLPAEQIDEVCEIVAHHHTAGIVETLNFKVVYDADWLVNLKDHYDVKDTEKIIGIIDKIFLTKSGNALAKKLFVEDAA